MPQPQQIPQFTSKEFIKSFKEQNPDFKDENDDILMKAIMEADPSIQRQIGDKNAEMAQNRALEKSRAGLQFGHQVLNALPALGSAAGAVASIPTGGSAGLLTVPAGAAMGQGLQDIIERLTGVATGSNVPGMDKSVPQMLGNSAKTGTITGLLNALTMGLVKGGTTIGSNLLENPGLLGDATRATLKGPVSKILQPWKWGSALSELGEEPVTPPGQIKFNLERPGSYRMGEPLTENPNSTPNVLKATKTGANVPEPTGEAQRLAKPTTTTSQTMEMQPKYNFKIVRGSDGYYHKVPKE